MRTQIPSLVLAAALAAGCETDVVELPGGALRRPAEPSVVAVPFVDALVPIAPMTLLTPEGVGRPSWMRALRSVGALTQRLEIYPARVAMFATDPDADVTEPKLAAALAKRGFKLHQIERTASGWVLECTHDIADPGAVT